MIFNWVEIKNFKSYGDYETRIDLNINESRLLLGENGAGKTTFVDAIIWALYGKSLSNIDDIINRKTKVDCKVEVNFSVGRNNYSIIRYRNHSVHKNSVLIFRGKENISPRTANEAQTVILDIIEINYNAMVSSIIFSSELYISFLRSKPSDRLKIFENILSLKEIQLYHNAIKEMRKPIRAKLDELMIEQSKCNNEIVFTNNAISQYKENSKNSLLSFKNEKATLLAEIEGIKNDIETLKHIDVDSEIEKNRLYKELTESNTIIEEKISLETEKEKDVVPLSNELTNLKFIVETKRMVNVAAEKKRNADFKERLDFNNDIITKVTVLTSTIKDVDSIRDKIEEATAEISVADKKIKELMVNSETCPTCGQDVEKELTEKLIAEQARITVGLTEEVTDLVADKDKALKYNNDTLKEMNELNSQLKEGEDASIYNEEFLDSLATDINERQNKINMLEQQIAHTEEINNSIRESVKVLSDELKEVDVEPSSYDDMYLTKIKESIITCDAVIQDKEAEIKVINVKASSTYDKEYVKKFQTKIKKVKALLEGVNKKIQDKTLEDNHYDVLQQLFSNKSIGVKKYIIENMLHVFNEKVNFYLPFFFDNSVEINFSKDLEEEILVNDSTVAFSTFSSGEKTRLELAIAFSLFMVVKTFFSSTVNLLIFDEILDMNLDTEGVESVLNIINNLSDDNSIIVISHRDEYKENFHNQINMYKDANGYSKIR
jgi:DNA repair exonuclease SbcCD ATPase subunit